MKFGNRLELQNVNNAYDARNSKTNNLFDHECSLTTNRVGEVIFYLF
jgi:hypothetical protein